MCGVFFEKKADFSFVSHKIHHVLYVQIYRQGEIRIMGKMTIDEFAEYAKTFITKHFGNEVGVVCIFRENLPDKSVLKICIPFRESKIVPNLHLEPMYQLYLDDKMSVDEMLRMACEEIGAERKKIEDLESGILDSLFNFDNIKDKIFLYIESEEKFSEHPDGFICRQVADIVIHYKVVFTKEDSEGINLATIAITQSFLNRWGVDSETVHRYAVENSARVAPVKVLRIADIVSMKFVEAFEEYAELLKMAIVTNTYEKQGTSVIFYTDVLDKLADEFGSDLYLVPLSAHEWAVTASKECDAEIHKDAMSDMFSFLPKDMRLTKNVYRYNADTKKLKIA